MYMLEARIFHVVFSLSNFSYSGLHRMVPHCSFGAYFKIFFPSFIFQAIKLIQRQFYFQRLHTEHSSHRTQPFPQEVSSCPQIPSPDHGFKAITDLPCLTAVFSLHMALIYYFYLFIFWLHWVFFAACGLSLVAGRVPTKILYFLDNSVIFGLQMLSPLPF